MADNFGARLLAERLGSRGNEAGLTVGAAPPPLPKYVVHALARMRLLYGVPFQYLVPDNRLLPLESIRFFHLDSPWLDALARGAMAVAGDGSREQAQVRSIESGLEAAIGSRLMQVRDIERGRLTVGQAAESLTAGAAVPPNITGFLLRSALVSGWPGLQVRAFATDDPVLVPPDVDPQRFQEEHPELVVPVLSMERLAPSVLLVLFAGTPRLVWFAEPHHGVQFGVDAAGGGYSIPLRDEAGKQLPGTVEVSLRPGAEALGVVDVQRLAQKLDAARPLGSPRGSAALALALLRPPARQRFAASIPSGDPT
jgi:hypothetical protein